MSEKDILRLDEGILLDPSKADTELRHKFMLPLKAAENVIEEKKPYVICDYFTDKTWEKCVSASLKQGNEIGYAEIFANQVKEVHNILHPTEDREVTVEELCNTKYNDMVYAIKTAVALHLINSSKLNRNEIPNS